MKMTVSVDEEKTASKEKLQKGMYGFHNKKKKREILKTVILFGIALAVYFTGLLHTGSNKNLLTIVAIVGMLPASKAAVSMIMAVRYNAVSATLFEQLNRMIPQRTNETPADSPDVRGMLLYDFIFVLNEKVVKTDCIYLKDTSLLIFTANSSMPDTEIARYLKNFLANHGKGSTVVKVCKSEQEFVKQVKSRLDSPLSEESTENQNIIRDMLVAFSM